MKTLFFFLSIMLCAGVAGATDIKTSSPDNCVRWNEQAHKWIESICTDSGVAYRLVGPGNEKGDFIKLPGIQPESDLEKRVKALEDCVYDPCHTTCPKSNVICY